MILVNILSSNTIAALQQESDSKTHEAQWNQAQLTVESLTLPMRRVRENWPFEKRVGPYLIRVEKEVLEVVDFASLKSVWKDKATNGHEYQLIGTNERTLFLVEVNRHQIKKEAKGVSVLRRDLSTGKALETVVIPSDSTKEATSTRLIGAITRPDCVYLLTMHFAEKDGFREKPVSYQLTRFSDAIDWSENFESAGALEPPGAFILGTRGPAFDGVSSQTLIELDSKLIVSAGPLEDVMAIDPRTGETEWRIPRIWEYRRGFIGPSVWRYYLGRYGIEDYEIEIASKTLEQIKEEEEFSIDEEYLSEIKKQVEAARDKFKDQPGWILAGPVAIKTGGNRNETRLFLVSAQSDGNSGWANYLANAVVYELDDEGELISSVTLPRLLQRNEFSILSDRIVWHCQDGSTLELFPTQGDRSSDTFTKINWKIAKEVPERKAWLRQGRYSLSRDYYGPYMFSLSEGGYLEQSESQEINFPILVTNLASEEKKELLLRLPFQGKAYTPTNNYSHGPNGWVSLSHYLYTITNIQVDETTLFVTIEDEHMHNKILEFDISRLIESLKKN